MPRNDDRECSGRRKWSSKGKFSTKWFFGSECARDVESKRYMSGQAIPFWGGLVGWQASKQKSIAASNTNLNTLLVQNFFKIFGTTGT